MTYPLKAKNELFYAQNFKLFEKLNSLEKYSDDWRIVRDEIFELNMNAAKIAAQPFLHEDDLRHYHDNQDKIALAMEVLLKAIEDYDPQKGSTFYQWAKTKIENRLKGVWQNEARKMKNPLHPCRATHYDVQIGSDNDPISLKDLIIDERALDEIYQICHTNENAISQLKENMKSLTPHQREVIKLMFLTDKGRQTNQRVADELGCSRQSVNDAVKRAFKKLSKNFDNALLLEELEDICTK